MATQRTQDNQNPYTKFNKDLKLFNASQLLEIETMSTLTFEEVKAYFMIIDEPSEREQKIVQMAMARGRAKGIKRAADKLFTNMSDGKQGVQACLSYLKRFSKEFEKEVDDSEGAGGISYNVTISAPNEPKEPGPAKGSKNLVAIK